MKRKRHSAEQIIAKLREAEVLLQQRQVVPQVCRQLGVTAQTYYRWRKEYGGMRVDQAKRLKDLEKENTRLKRIVADQALVSVIKIRPAPLSGVSRRWRPVATPPPARRSGGEDHPHAAGRRLGRPATAESQPTDLPVHPSVACERARRCNRRHSRGASAADGAR